VVVLPAVWDDCGQPLPAVHLIEPVVCNLAESCPMFIFSIFVREFI